MQYVNLEQRSEEWKAWRKTHITATEAVAICGHSKFRTPYDVWMEKTDRKPAPDLTVIPAVRYGMRMEDHVRDLFMTKHSDIFLPVCGVSDEYPYFSASFDGLNADLQPLEIKCPSKNTQLDLLKHREASATYQMYWHQVQWQLMVSGATKGWLIFFLGNDKLIEFEVHRDEGAIKAMVQTCNDFWFNHLLADVAPQKSEERDEFIPEGDAETAWLSAAQTYGRLKQEIDRLNALLEEPKKELIRLMGNFSKANFGGVCISRFKQSGSIDYKRLLASTGVSISESQLESFRRKDKDVVKISIHPSELSNLPNLNVETLSSSLSVFEPKRSEADEPLSRTQDEVDVNDPMQGIALLW